MGFLSSLKVGVSSVAVLIAADDQRLVDHQRPTLRRTGIVLDIARQRAKTMESSEVGRRPVGVGSRNVCETGDVGRGI